MVFKTTSTSRQRGMTFPELMVALGIGAIVLTAVALLSFHTARSYAALANYVDLDQHSRRALDIMAQEIRQSSRLLEFSEHQLVLEYNGANLTYAYSSGGKVLTRTYGGVSETLLKECDALKFSVFQRNPINGTYDQYPTGTAATGKLVQLSWTCSRKILGQAVNTESVQSAKIVLRKQG